MNAGRYFVSALLAVSLVALAGCIPPRVVWLPDSSGFIFTSDGPWDQPSDSSAQLFHYDLNKKAARLVAKVPSSATMMPGISPDGKQAAVVRVEFTAQKLIAQVILVDLETGQLRETKSAQIGEWKKQPRFCWATAEWSPKGDHLMRSTGERRTVVYSATGVSISPAPDGKKLAIRYYRDGNYTEQRILVIDDEGTTVANFGVKQVDDSPVAKGSLANPEAAETQGAGRDRTASSDDSYAEAEKRALAARQKAAEERLARALAADPWLRDDLEAAHRYFAACSNLRPGVGHPVHKEADRGKLRREALASLQADLALRERQLKTGTPEARAKVQQILSFWKIDPELAPVRDHDLLAKLPEAEQADWNAFWEAAAALEHEIAALDRPSHP